MSAQLERRYMDNAILPESNQRVGGEVWDISAPGTRWDERVGCRMNYAHCPALLRGEMRDQCAALVEGNNGIVWCGKDPKAKALQELIKSLGDSVVSELPRSLNIVP